MLDRIIADIGCNVDIALQWAINAKNSLANIDSFSPHQIVFLRNPQLPSILTDKPPALLPYTDLSRVLVDNLISLYTAQKAFIEAEN